MNCAPCSGDIALVEIALGSIVDSLAEPERQSRLLRFAVARASRFGGFLSLIALATPCSIRNSPLQDGHLRCEETITVCMDV